MRKKDMTAGVALFATIILGGISVQAAETDTESKVNANLISGGLTLEAFDLDLGNLTLGEDLTNKGKNEDIVKVTDYTGGNGWSLNVKQTNYTDVNNTLGLTLTGDDGEVNLTDSDAFFATDKSQIDPIIRNSTISANWGNTPKIGEYKADLTWTLSPGITIADTNLIADEQSDKTLVAILRPAYTDENGVNHVDVYGRFQENSDGTVSLIESGLNGKYWPWGGSVDMDGEITLPDKVNGKKLTKVSSNVFYYAKFTGEFNTPKYLNSIGYQAFPNSVFTGPFDTKDLKVIDGNAFRDSKFTGTFIANDNLTSIGSEAFSSSKFTGTFESNNLKSIGQYAFKNSRFSGAFTAGDSLTNISSEAFYLSGFTGTFDSSNIETIGSKAFFYSKFTGSFDAKKLTSIGSEAFYNSKFDGNFINGENLKSVPSGAFTNSVFTGSFDTKNLTSIGSNAFENSVFEGPFNTNKLLTIGNYAFDLSKFTGSFNSNELTSIGTMAFRKSEFGENFVMSDSLKSIGTWAFLNSRFKEVKDNGTAVLGKSAIRMEDGTDYTRDN